MLSPDLTAAKTLKNYVDLIRLKLHEIHYSLLTPKPFFKRASQSRIFSSICKTETLNLPHAQNA